jgi:3-hydroxyisobutyrate dehydrogenase-like beta-hydroxyacid dehydrogenase
MSLVVSILAQGTMGAGTAARLTENGVEVRTMLAGRSAASVRRAGAAGMRNVTEQDFVDVDFVLSIVPPAEAEPTARRLAPFLSSTARKPLYVDFNAINPDTVRAIAAVVQPTGADFVDGGIIGGPPRKDYAGPAYYVSGAAAGRTLGLRDPGLNIRVLDGVVGTASALKMSYAGISKGMVALASAMILAAQRAGVADHLHAELASSQATLLAGFARSVPSMFSKAGRWVAEMEQIAEFAGKELPEHDLYLSISRFYERLGKDFGGTQTEIAALTKFFPSTKS